MPRTKEFDYTEKLEIARSLFWEKGYHATSMHDIVSRMQLNRSSIYDTYGNKHDLFLKCLSNYAKLKEDQYLKASQVKEKAIDALEYMIRDVVRQTILDNRSCLIVKTIFEVAATDEEVRLFIIKNGTTLQSILQKHIDQALREGDIKSKSKSTSIARYILSSFSGFWSHYTVTQNKQEVDEMVDFLIEQLTH